MNQHANLPDQLIEHIIKVGQAIVDRSDHEGEDIGILFLDQRKAFDQVSHD